MLGGAEAAGTTRKAPNKDDRKAVERTAPTSPLTGGSVGILVPPLHEKNASVKTRLSVVKDNFTRAGATR